MRKDHPAFPYDTNPYNTIMLMLPNAVNNNIIFVVAYIVANLYSV